MRSLLFDRFHEFQLRPGLDAPGGAAPPGGLAAPGHLPVNGGDAAPEAWVREDLTSLADSQEFFCRFRFDQPAIRTLREVFLNVVPSRSFSGQSDDEVIEQLAWMLMTRRLTVWKRPLEGLALSYVGVKRTSTPRPAPAAPPAPPPRAAPAPPPKEDSNLDAAAQAAALREAARDGVPFCEECEKQRKAARQEEQAAAPAPPPGAPPEEVPAEPAVAAAESPAAPAEEESVAEPALDAAPEEAGLAEPAAAVALAQGPPPQEEPPVKTWVEVELVGEDGEPVGGKQYRIKLPDGSTKSGVLDRTGKVRVEEIDAGDVEITFPELDQDAWEPA
jgi:hypothetical protein